MLQAAIVFKIAALTACGINLYKCNFCHTGARILLQLFSYDSGVGWTAVSLPRLEIIPSVSSAFHLHSSITCQHNYITSRPPPVAAVLTTMMRLMLHDDVFGPVATERKDRPRDVFLDPRKIHNRIVSLQKCNWLEVNSLGAKSSEEKLEDDCDFNYCL